MPAVAMRHGNSPDGLLGPDSTVGLRRRFTGLWFRGNCAPIQRRLRPGPRVGGSFFPGLGACAEARSQTAHGCSDRRGLWAAVTAVWLMGVVAGLSVLARFDNTPGVEATALSPWPADSTLARTPGLPTVVLLAHPQCSVWGPDIRPDPPLRCSRSAALQRPHHGCARARRRQSGATRVDSAAQSWAAGPVSAHR
jgi:hypothetical protein